MWWFLVLLGFGLLVPPVLGAAQASEDQFDPVPWLASPDTATWREAQARIALNAKPYLSALESEAMLAADDVRRRLRSTILLAMLFSLEEEVLETHDNLYALVADDLRFCDRLLESVGSVDVGDIYLAARQIAGACVPAALELCGSPHPIARSYGISLLGGLGSPLAIPTLRSLTDDDAVVAVVRGDAMGNVALNDEAASALLRIEELSRPEYIPTKYLYALELSDSTASGVAFLIGRMRLISPYHPTSAWWDSVRPSWREWWANAGNGWTEQERAAWHAQSRAYEGFVLDAVAGGGGRLNIVAPQGRRCTVTVEGVVKADAQIPVYVDGLNGKQVTVTVNLREKTWEKSFFFGDETCELSIIPK